MLPLQLPGIHTNIQCVSSFAQLLQTPFVAGVNALCWPRVLEGDFAEVVAALGRTNENVTQLDSLVLASLPLSADGKRAVEVMLSDLEILTDQGFEPELNLVAEYPRDPRPVPTDVYSFHVDQAPVETDTWLCTYYGTGSQGLRNDDAQACVHIDAVRDTLLQEFGGAGASEFEAYLRENSYHLHYRPKAGAQPWSFGVGHLWRIAVAWPGSPVPPCIHRAPMDIAGQPRLLLIS